jgi:hypothetical protein
MLQGQDRDQVLALGLEPILLVEARRVDHLRRRQRQELGHLQHRLLGHPAVLVLDHVQRVGENAACLCSYRGRYVRVSSSFIAAVRYGSGTLLDLHRRGGFGDPGHGLYG